MKAIRVVMISVFAAVTLAACGPASDSKDTAGKTTSKAEGMKGMDMSKGAMKGMDTSKGDMKGMDMKGMQEKSSGTHKAAATVRSADTKAGTVTLDHGPVPSMNWPAMSMTFKLKDKAMMEQLAAGKKVEVEFVQEGKDYVITAVK
jgi:Cu(I)/Ag(I) efflux system protein CusF